MNQEKISNMHKGIILLVKTNSEEDAEDLVVEFLTNYRDIVYDWYEIGGRWDKLLGNSNIMKLSKCLDIVKDYKKDLQKEIEEAWNTLLESKNGYHAKVYARLKNGEFCDDSCVYNITTGEAEEIPEDIDKYYAVIVDIHY